MIDNVIVLSDLVESSGYSSKTRQKGSCPYAPLDEVLRYTCRSIKCHVLFQFVKIALSGSYGTALCCVTTGINHFSKGPIHFRMVHLISSLKTRVYHFT